MELHTLPRVSGIVLKYLPNKQSNFRRLLSNGFRILWLL